MNREQRRHPRIKGHPIPSAKKENACVDKKVTNPNEKKGNKIKAAKSAERGK